MKKIFAMVAVVLMAASSMAANYRLVGYINNADYDGYDYPLTVDEAVEYEFSVDTYVFVKDDGGNQFMADKYMEFKADGLSADLVKTGNNKLQVAKGLKVKFTLTVKDGNTVSLAYEVATSGETVYYIKSKWAVDAPDWEWKEMTPNGDKSEWTYTGDFYGSGCNVSTIAVGNGTWFANDGAIAGDKIAEGDNVTFTYNVAAKTLTAKKNTAAAVENVAVEAKAIKVIENGQIVIIRDGVRYNAVGAAL